MQVYLVGGAVRDAALGLPVGERDWVVVGATPAELTRAGYTAVGREFPVFLHPETKEEHALARLERKTAPGYRGFVTEFSPEVTLEDDLARRDLTVNAMARAAEGALIDPYGGQRDLEARVLRHVSPAFVEDPVRILRVARFAARFAPLGFTVAPETLALMRAMVDSGEAAALVAERVWQETARALATGRPDVFFEVLRDCGALAVIFPEIDALFGVPQPAQWHPEIDAGVHTLMVLAQAARLSEAATVRFAALTHDLGKAKTPRERWPMHHGHEAASVALVDALCDRLKTPNEHRELARLAARYHCDVHRAAKLRATTILTMFERCDAFRRPERFGELLLACEADARGRLGFEERPYPQAGYLHACLAAARAVALDEAARAGLDGATIGIRLHELRAQAIAAVKAGGAGPAAQIR
ncbi:MAG: multifunctional CCA addition/repair protein [Steroidobacteraceae bacterium]